MIIKIDHPDANIIITTPHNKGHEIVSAKIQYEMKSGEDESTLELVKTQFLWEMQSSYGLYGHKLNLASTTNTDLSAAVMQITKRSEEAVKLKVTDEKVKTDIAFSDITPWDKLSNFITKSTSSKDGEFYSVYSNEIALAIRKYLPFKVIEIDTGGVTFAPYKFPAKGEVQT